MDEEDKGEIPTRNIRVLNIPSNKSYTCQRGKHMHVYERMLAKTEDAGKWIKNQCNRHIVKHGRFLLSY